MTLQNFVAKKYIAAFLIVAQFASITAQAQTSASGSTSAPAVPPAKSTYGFSVAEDLRSGTGANEFVVGKFPGAVMMRVNLWGGVRQPGIYHIPVGTDLVTLLSYAGGPNQNAELDETIIKRKADAKEEVIEVDVDQLLRGKPIPELNPGLRVNDIVVVPETQPIVSQNTLLILSVVATLASIAVASVIISQNSR